MRMAMGFINIWKLLVERKTVTAGNGLALATEIRLTDFITQ